MKTIIFFFSLVLNLFALGCNDYKDFVKFDNKYYTITVNKLTFNEAKQVAENNGGYLAIPNSQSENDFLQNMIGGNSYAWIGVYDPLLTPNYCYDSSNCVNDDSRFKDIKNQSLTFKNWAEKEPNNFVYPDDVSSDGKSFVSPLGEYWVGMFGNNGKWFDIGNHVGINTIPVSYRAIFEFDTKPECFLKSDNVLNFDTPKCNTQIFDSETGIVENGSTFDCQKDIYNNDYCPSALAEAGQQWEYDESFSVAGVGTTMDYTKKINGSIVETPKEYKLVFNNSQACYKDYTTVVSGIKVKNNFYRSIGASGISFYTSSYNRFGGGNSAKTIYYGNYKIVMGNRNGTCRNGGSRSYTFPFSIYKKECISGTESLNDPNLCLTGTPAECPSGYVETTGEETLNGECKKTIEYTYYEYQCKNETNEQGFNYTVVNSGGDSGKTDPDPTSNNTDTLDNDLNSSTAPINNCKREKFVCQANEDRPAVWIDNKWQCSPFPCFGGEDVENLDTDVAINDKNNNGWNEDGGCDGDIKIFNGKTMTCRNKDLFFGMLGGGCCNKDNVFLGLVACRADEKLLAKKREAEQTHRIGNFCSKKLKLGLVKICIQWSDSYCTFNSKLAQIIQVQGREQLNIGWGSAENPECSGFSPDEFQRIDFSKIDMSSFYEDISLNVSNFEEIGTFVQSKISNFLD